MSDPASEFDGPWKEALDLYFRYFIELFFPEIDRDVDWERALEFQDKELQQIAPTAATGRGIVDKLVKVWTRHGKQECVFVHVEVQTQNDPNLAQRMYQYNHRLEDKYGSMPVSLAVLGDYGRGWRPTEFQAGRWGCEVKFTFPVAKVADWRNKEHKLEQSPNPFTAFILAHLKTVETDRNPDDRLTWKLRVVKRLYDRGMSYTDLLQMFRLIDWMMTLPPDLANTFTRDIEAFEKEKEMPIITPSERLWKEQGRTEGRTEGRFDGIQLGLKLRFGSPGLDLMPRVRQLTDPGAVETFFNAIETAPDLGALRNMLPPQPQV